MTYFLREGVSQFSCRTVDILPVMLGCLAPTIGTRGLSLFSVTL
jgi:hypothetical protein